MEHLIWSELLVKVVWHLNIMPVERQEGKMFMGKNYIELDKEKLLPAFAAALQKYFDVDPQMVRLLCVALILAYGSGLLVYIIFAIFVPKEPKY